ncbi:helix-turn-helix domain-containing protein [Stutzerimonas stutzeri]|uniref:helix-turn-helix domain-containing protein n=1 Tax=Stutzerimonas stutzeri TaxID=316 RepID=UPI003AF53EA8
MNWAWEQQLPPVPKLTLLALADNADDHGYCWPKMRTIAAKCCTSERTIQRTIKSLLGTGCCTKQLDSMGQEGKYPIATRSHFPTPTNCHPLPSSEAAATGRVSLASPRARQSCVMGGVTQLCHP